MAGKLCCMLCVAIGVIAVRANPQKHAGIYVVSVGDAVSVAEKTQKGVGCK